MPHVLCPLLVGRRAELTVVRDRLAAAGRGSGGLQFVVGEAGIGKSRLVREVAEDVRRGGGPVLTGRAVPGPTNAPFRPFAEILMQVSRDRPAAFDPDLMRWIPALRAVLPGLAPDQPVAALSLGAGEASALRGEALLRLLDQCAAGRQLLVVLEDLHWADPETLSAVEYLADNLAGTAILVVATARGGASPATDLARRLRQRGAADVLELVPLAPAAVAEMVRACRPDADAALVGRVQAIADGVPLLVEEVLAAPQAVGTVAETVGARVADLDEDRRRVLSVAAILGRDFDWRLLPGVTGLDAEAVTTALESFVDDALVEVVGDGFRFRHALIRDAVVDGILPPRRSALARAALAVLDNLRPGTDHADVALLAGDRVRAAAMLKAAGDQALRLGALGTAAEALRRAAELADDPATRRAAEVAQIRALALAGRLDEATAVAARLWPGRPESEARAVHLELAAAAVAATRWEIARAHLDAAAAGPLPEPIDAARIDVLAAEIDLAADDLDAARRAAAAALATADGAGAGEIACHALELLGRSHRVQDLGRARAEFERAYERAVSADLPVWRLRALHELGTIDLLDHGGIERLTDARAIAERLGLLSTVAVLDVELAGAYLQRFEVTASLEAARRAVTLSATLRLGRIRAIAHVFEACVQAVRGDRDAGRAAAVEALRAAPDDPEIQGFLAAGSTGMVELLWGSRSAALTALDEGVTALNAVARSAPGPYRGIWPLLVAATGRADAPKAIASVQRSGVAVNRVNRGFLAYAEAVLDRSVGAVRRGDADLGFFPTWRDIGRALVGEAALRDGWGEPRAWLADAQAGLTTVGLDALARHCDRLLRPAPAGSTPREADVLGLVAAGLSNREIAERLRLSVRTVEKHVESLLRKAGARSRTQLAAMMRNNT